MSSRHVTAFVALLAGLALAAPDAARAWDCIDCSEEAAMDVAVTAWLAPSPFHAGWSTVEVVVRQEGLRFDGLPRWIPPTQLHVRFVESPGLFGAGRYPGNACGWVDGEFGWNCDVPGRWSSSGPAEYTFGFVVWGEEQPGVTTRWTAAVDTANLIPEWDEQNNTASLDFPWWAHRITLQEWTGEPEVSYP